MSTPASDDAFYGHEQIARLCARFITHLFACPEYPSTPSSSPSTLKAPTSPKLSHFIAYALHRTRLHSSVTFAALLLLQRLKTRFPDSKGSSGHRLFIASYMLASKVICDDTYSNKSWTIVAQGLFSLREINVMEREFCQYLDWRIRCEDHELRAFRARLEKETFLQVEDLSEAIMSRIQEVTLGAASANSPNTPMRTPRPPHGRFPSSPDTPGTPSSDSSGHLSTATSPSPTTPPKLRDELLVRVADDDNEHHEAQDTQVKTAPQVDAAEYHRTPDALTSNLGVLRLTGQDIPASVWDVDSDHQTGALHIRWGVLGLVGMDTVVLPHDDEPAYPFNVRIPDGVFRLYDHYDDRDDFTQNSMDLDDNIIDAFATPPSPPRLPPIPLPPAFLSPLPTLAHLSNLF